MIFRVDSLLKKGHLLHLKRHFRFAVRQHDSRVNFSTALAGKHRPFVNGNPRCDIRSSSEIMVAANR